ncbi:MAG TPA: Lacal_2735 family protein [Aequorivita sp.]|nr:Lacal_2735 family protein [Aequorivita sp.]
MISWFRKKSRIEKLKERYTSLMKRSYETALKDTDKSEKMHRQADKLFQEIKYLSLQRNDK